MSANRGIAVEQVFNGVLNMVEECTGFVARIDAVIAVEVGNDGRASAVGPGIRRREEHGRRGVCQ